ncbi:MAG: hypothetical protein JNN08_23115 [Bryobacterales bacterium]|nr:hypothetical protein [Bryobacterales bacterium]
MPSFFEGLTLVLSLVALLIAFFGSERIWERLRPPNLTCKVEDPHFTQLGVPPTGVPCLFSRLIIANDGYSMAEDVEVYASALYRMHPVTGVAELEHEFPAMDLKWAHVGMTRQKIAAGLSKPCDLGCVADFAPGEHPLVEVARERSRLSCQSRLLVLSTEVEPYTARHILGEGHYKLHLKIASANAPLLVAVLEIAVTGTWSPTEPERVFKVKLLETNISPSCCDRITGRLDRIEQRLNRRLAPET